jgi:hypothetical protein
MHPEERQMIAPAAVSERTEAERLRDLRLRLAGRPMSGPLVADVNGADIPRENPAPGPPAPILAFSRDVLGFPLFPRQSAIVQEIYTDGIRTALLRLGRRSGKGRVAAVVATYEGSVNAPAHLAAVPAGEQVAIVVVATSQRQARITHRYIRAFFRVPELASLVARDTDDELELTNGIVIATVPCHAAAARGSAVAVVILDEAAWYAGRDGSPLDAKEIYDALAPATAQFAERRVLVLSTPRWSTGWFADMCALAASGEFPDMRTWHATTAEMNPRISRAFLDQERAKDPPAFRREYEAEFDSGIGAVFEADLVRAAVREAERLPALPDVRYAMAIDPAFTGDTFAAIVGHVETSGRVVVDLVQGWRGTRGSPVQVDSTLDELALLASAYNRARVLTDQYAAQPIRQGLASRGLNVSEKPWTNETKVDAVAAVRRCLYGSRLEIPPHRELVSELVTLEQRPMPSGRPRIAAPGGGHDDFATALLALVAELDSPTESGLSAFYRSETERMRSLRAAAAGGDVSARNDGAIAPPK